MKSHPPSPQSGDGQVQAEALRRKFKAVIAYDGTSYAGWQHQGNALAVQQVVEEALAWLNGSPVRIYGSSRTDSGVHAKGFVAHFWLEKPIPPDKVLRAMNSRLPESIRFLKVAKAGKEFHAQLSAAGKEYRYQLYQADIMPPHLVPYWTYCHRSLDLEAMQKAASYFEGKHDFKSFSANSDRIVTNTVREIFSCKVKKSGHKYVIIVRGNGFLYKMVRSIAGFLLSVGKGNERPEAVKELLDRHEERTARVETAPARGLFLWKVFYKRPADAKAVL